MANPFRGEDQDDFEAARDEEGNIKQTGLARTAKLSPFGLAFDEARKAGEKTFTFKGKKYTTEMAKDKPKAAPKATPKAEPAKPEAKKERPGFFRRAVAALGGVKLPQDPGPDKKEEKDEKPTTRPKPVSTAAAIAAKNAGYKKGGMVKSSASKRADGCAVKGKTRGKMV